MTWNKIAFDKFDNQKTKWDLTSYYDSIMKISFDLLKGEMKWNANIIKEKMYYRVCPYRPLSDFYVSVDARVDSTLPINANLLCFGIVFRKIGYNSYYSLEFWKTNHFILYFQTENSNDKKILINWTYIPNIDITIKNKYAVIAEGNKITVFINNDKYGECIDSTSLSGNVGLMIGNSNGLVQPNITVFFSNFELYSK
jgi:hypothetical protein